MVTIISKSDGPRREDEAARRLIQSNRGAITRLADQLSQGAYSASRAQRAAAAQGTAEQGGRSGLVAFTGPAAAPEPAPYVRISPNARVVVADAESGRQLQFLGEIRRRDGARVFILATRENGFIAPAEPVFRTALADLDGRTLDADFDEDDLASEIGRRLALP